MKVNNVYKDDNSPARQLEIPRGWSISEGIVHNGEFKCNIVPIVDGIKVVDTKNTREYYFQVDFYNTSTKELYINLTWYSYKQVSERMWETFNDWTCPITKSEAESMSEYFTTLIRHNQQFIIRNTKLWEAK